MLITINKHGSSHKARIPREFIPVEPRISTEIDQRMSSIIFNSSFTLKQSAKTLKPLKLSKKTWDSVNDKNRPIEPWEMFSITPPKK